MKAYYNGFRRSGIARVHILRERPVRPQRGAWGGNRNFPQSWCGMGASEHPQSPRVPVDPAQPLADGLSWCGTCLGRAAEHAGLLTELAALLTGAEVSDVG